MPITTPPLQKKKNQQAVKLKAFSKFENTAEALKAATCLIESKPYKGLRKFLKSHCDGETLGVADSKLGNAIKDMLVCSARNLNTGDLDFLAHIGV